MLNNCVVSIDKTVVAITTIYIINLLLDFPTRPISTMRNSDNSQVIMFQTNKKLGQEKIGSDVALLHTGLCLFTLLFLFVFVNHGRQVTQPQVLRSRASQCQALLPVCLPSPGTKASKVGMRRRTFQTGQQSVHGA